MLRGNNALETQITGLLVSDIQPVIDENFPKGLSILARAAGLPAPNGREQIMRHNNALYLLRYLGFINSHHSGDAAFTTLIGSDDIKHFEALN